MWTFRTVWLLRNLSLEGELCPRDGKNAAFLYVHHLLPLQASMENVMLCPRISHKPFLIVESALFGDHVSLRKSRASKSPDFSGDLPIFWSNNENLPISRFGIKISRFFTKDYASTVDRQFCHSSRRIDFQSGEFFLQPFANCVVIEKKYSVHVFAAPGRRHIRRDTVVPHARNLDFAIAWPSLGLIRSLATGTKAS